MTKKTAEPTPLERRTADLISVAKAAEISGFSESYVRKLVSTGVIDGVKLGRNWLTTEEAIREYLKTERRRGRPRQSNRD